MSANILWINTGAWWTDVVILLFHLALVFGLIYVPYMFWKEQPQHVKQLARIAFLKTRMGMFYTKLRSLTRSGDAI